MLNLTCAIWGALPMPVMLRPAWCCTAHHDFTACTMASARIWEGKPYPRVKEVPSFSSSCFVISAPAARVASTLWAYATVSVLLSFSRTPAA